MKKGSNYYMTPCRELPKGLLLTVLAIENAGPHGEIIKWTDGSWTKVKVLEDPNFGFWVTEETIFNLMMEAGKCSPATD